MIYSKKLGQIKNMIKNELINHIIELRRVISNQEQEIERLNEDNKWLQKELKKK